MARRMILIAAFLGLSGCYTRSVRIDLHDLPFPVLVGPVECVGSTESAVRNGRLISSVEGETSTSFAAGSGTTTEHAYGDVSRSTTTTTVGSTQNNSIAANFMRETQGSSRRIVLVQKIKAVNTTHLSIFALQGQSLSIKGEVWEPAQ